MIVTNQQLDGIKSAVLQALAARGALYDGTYRVAFARGINFQYFAGLPMVPAPGHQLDLDLINFNNVERLADGSVPLEIWLRNAIAFLRAQQEATVLQQVLDLVTRRVSGAPAVIDPTAPDLPTGSLPGGLEQTIQRDDKLPFRFISGAQRVGAAVAQLGVPEFEHGQPKLKNGEPIVHLGTGWLVLPDLLMTNWHVVNAREEGAGDASPADLELQVKALVARFDFDADDVQGHPVAVAQLAAADKALDYALVRLQAPAAGRAPLTLVQEPLSVLTTADYMAVNIVQHPGGRAKQVAIRNNLVYRATYPSVSYFTDTDGGSSGSPVCRDDWRVVALHRSWKAVTGVQFMGKSTAWVNEGTQIAAILEHLQQHYAAVHTEIVNAQVGM
jgi:endonuclease G, mitochondrial